MSLLTARGRLSRWAAVAGLACVGVAAWRSWRTDRRAVLLDQRAARLRAGGCLLGADGRAISLPGGPADLVASWFKGSNFENFLFRGHVVNGRCSRSARSALRRCTTTSRACRQTSCPSGRHARPVRHRPHPAAQGLLTSYRMAFDYERYKVLGPLTALEMERLLDRDSRLTKCSRVPIWFCTASIRAQTMGVALRERTTRSSRRRTKHPAAVSRCGPHRRRCAAAAAVLGQPVDAHRSLGRRRA